MANYGSANVRIDFDDSAGTPQDMSQYITEMNEMSIEAVLEESHTFGDGWAEAAYAKFRKAGDITLGGFYNDAASTGPDAVFNDPGCVAGPAGGTRTFKTTWGGTKTTSVETIIMSYKRIPVRGQLTKFQVVLRPTGAVTEV